MRVKQPPQIAPTSTPKISASGLVSYKVVTLGNAHELALHSQALENLAASAGEPNVFYEPWMILPAIKAFGQGMDLVFVLIYEKGQNGEAGLLSGFFPFERRARFARLPARTFVLWQYQECYLSTPLLRRRCEVSVLRALIEWAASSPTGADIVEGIEIGGGGPVHSSVFRALHGLGLRHIAEWRDRPLMLPRLTFEHYLRLAVSGDRRRVLRSRQRNLEKLGPINFTEPVESTLDAWIDTFLEIEASGWKGRQKVAAACHDNTREFFRTVIHEAFRRGRLDGFSMNAGQVPVAARCSFLASPGAFLYKSAYQEQYSRYSPGVLLELERVRRAHESRDACWVDSCVSPSFDHYLPWLDRRAIADIAWSTGTFRGNLVIRAAPLVRRVKAWLARRKAPVNPKGELSPAELSAPGSERLVEVSEEREQKRTVGSSV